MKIKFTIFAFLFLQFAESNSMMLRNLARALTVNGRVTLCSRLALRHYMTQQERKEAEEKFGAPAEDVEKARLNLYETHSSIQSAKFLLVSAVCVPVGAVFMLGSIVSLISASDMFIPASLMTAGDIYLMAMLNAKIGEEKFNPSDMEIKSEVNRLRNRRQTNNEN